MRSALLVMFLLLPVCIFAQSSPEQCIKNHNAPPANSYYWPPDTDVKVYFHRTMFTVAERQILLAKLKTWSEIADAAGAGVKFSYAGEIEGMINCTSCLRIARRNVHRTDPAHYAFFYPLELDSDGLLISARIDLDYGITNSDALQSFFAHELGHGMGLWDCTTCKKKQTIMNAFPRLNRDNGLIAPSNCDVEVVREVYELRRRLRNTTLAVNN